MGIESLIKEIADMLGHDVDKIDAVMKDGKIVVTIKDVDEDDFDDADDDFDGDD